MPKRLIVINALLLVIAAGGAVFIVRQLLSPMPMPQAGRGAARAPGPHSRGDRSAIGRRVRVRRGP